MFRFRLGYSLGLGLKLMATNNLLAWSHGSSLRNDDYRLFPSNDDEIFDVMDIKEVTFFFMYTCYYQLCKLIIQFTWHGKEC